MENFIIFSLARCGSSSLMNLLKLHRGIRCLNEPFNPNSYEGRYLRSVSKAGNVDSVLAQLWQFANGIKHVWQLDGWPFPSASYNNHILNSGARIVFLRRRNVLKRIVSYSISLQLDEWTFAFPEDRRRLQSFSFRPLNTDFVRWHVANEARLLDETRKRFDARADLMELWYEDLYDTAISLGEKHKVLDRIRNFLSIPPPDDSEVVSKIDQRVSPGIRVNSKETYSRIPGIEKVEEEFGSDETGWLFR